MGDDVFQANNLPSTRTPRGHQGPAGFLMLVSGLDKVTVAEFSYLRTSLDVFYFIFMPLKLLFCSFLSLSPHYSQEHEQFTDVEFSGWEYDCFI
jgi:hypothetical protein